MDAITALLDKAKQGRSLASDNALAGVLRLHRQAVSKWRTRESWPSEEHIAQLAEMAGEDAGVWMVRIRAERDDGPVGDAWRKLAKRLASAAVLAMGLCLAQLSAIADSVRIMNIM